MQQLGEDTYIYRGEKGQKPEVDTLQKGYASLKWLPHRNCRYR